MKLYTYEQRDFNARCLILGLKFEVEDRVFAVHARIAEEMLFYHGTDVKHVTLKKLFRNLQEKFFETVLAEMNGYRQRAAVEFEGVEGLDDSLWKEFDGSGLL